MEEESKESPSLPANYVTLAQLQERWLKEQERKQIEKQNQERELQQQLDREKFERERKQREEDDAKNRTLSETTKAVTAKTAHHRDRRHQHRRDRKDHESQIQPDVVDDVARVTEESRKLQPKNTKSSRKKEESRAAIIEAGETAEIKPDEVKKVVVEKTQEVEGAKRKIQINGHGNDRKGKQWVEKDKVLVGQTPLSIAQNFEGLSVNGRKEGTMRPREERKGRDGGSGRKEGTMRPREERNGRDGGYRRGSGRVDVHSELPRRRRDGKYVWVKKGDSSDAGVNGDQC